MSRGSRDLLKESNGLFYVNHPIFDTAQLVKLKFILAKTVSSRTATKTSKLLENCDAIVE